MWPKCCPRFRSATWDQEHFTHLYVVTGSAPAHFFFSFFLHFRGWPREHIPFFCSSKNSFRGVLFYWANSFSHTQADISETSVERGGGRAAEYSWRAGTHFSPVNTLSLSPSLTHTHTHTRKKCKDSFHTSRHILISCLTALIHIKSACSLHTTAEHTHSHTSH